MSSPKNLVFVGNGVLDVPQKDTTAHNLLAVLLAKQICLYILRLRRLKIACAQDDSAIN